MAYPKEYIDFLVYFHGDRDYFECHEILEQYWKKTYKNNKDSIWVGLIQLAVANYHHRRGNFNGALRTIKKAQQICLLNETKFDELGIDRTLFFKQINKMLVRIERTQDYESLYLPINSEALLELCINRSRERNVQWGSKSDLSNTDLVHRHKQRDRTNVIIERSKALQNKRGLT